MSLNKGTRTRKDWLESEYKHIHPTESEHGTTAEGMAESAVQQENALIWAWYRDPETDLTQVEARDRAQGEWAYGPPKDYGQFNISQSSLSRLIKRLDDEMLLEPITIAPFNRKQSAEDYEGWEYSDGGVIDTLGHEFHAKHAPEVLDAKRAVIARTTIDWRAIETFTNANYRTPDWAINRFDIDPNTGLHLRKQRKHPDEKVDPHEPHDTS